MSKMVNNLKGTHMARVVSEAQSNSMFLTQWQMADNERWHPVSTRNIKYALGEGIRCTGTPPHTSTHKRTHTQFAQ